MKISVYIPSYNQRELLRAALESVINQTRQPDEIIVVDDASTDGSDELIHDYARRYDGLVRPVLHSTNLGVARARRDALELASGEVVTYVDGDDLFEPEKIATELAVMEANPWAAITFSNVAYVTEDNAEHLWDWVEADLPPQGEVFLQTFTRRFPRRSLFRMETIRMDALREVGFHDPTLPIYEDWDLRIRLTKRFAVAYTGTTQSRVRSHERGLANSSPALHLEAARRVIEKNQGLLEGLSGRERAYVDKYVNAFLGRLAARAALRGGRVNGRRVGFVDRARAVALGARSALAYAGSTAPRAARAAGPRSASARAALPSSVAAEERRERQSQPATLPRAGGCERAHEATTKAIEDEPAGAAPAPPDERMSGRVIFLVSQPRAGSTMLQRVLGAHSQIHTCAEPWIMLALTEALRPPEPPANQDAELMRLAVADFLAAVPGGETAGMQALRTCSAYLYRRAAEAAGKRFFLDKTPRYYRILPALYEIYPDAHYVFLLRNPLAVLASVVNTWMGRDRLYRLVNVKDDLLSAPRLLREGIEMIGQRATVVHYEALVRAPEQEVAAICAALGLEFEPAMLEYARQAPFTGTLGDPVGVQSYQRPVGDRVDAWESELRDPQVWRLARDYLDVLGRAGSARLGYSFDQLEAKLVQHQPARRALTGTISLRQCLRLGRASGVGGVLRKASYHGARVLLRAVRSRLGSRLR